MLGSSAVFSADVNIYSRVDSFVSFIRFFCNSNYSSSLSISSFCASMRNCCSSFYTLKFPTRLFNLDMVSLRNMLSRIRLSITMLLLRFKFSDIRVDLISTLLSFVGWLYSLLNIFAVVLFNLEVVAVN